MPLRSLLHLARDSSCPIAKRSSRGFNAPSAALWSLVASAAVGTLAGDAHAAFTNVTSIVGIDAFERVERPFKTEEFVVRGGHPIAMDFDGNGWLDIYIVRFGLPDIVYLNENGHFTRLDAPLGTLDTANGGNGAAWADIDNDGDKDFILSTSDEKRYRLYVNQGNGVYQDLAVERGIALPSTADHKGTSVAVGDLDRDGFLDAALGDWGVTVTDATRFEHFGVFLNQGAANPGHFQNATQALGIDFSPPRIDFFTPTIADLDGDGWPDLPILVDNGRTALYWNKADGTFVNSAAQSKVGIENHSMGTAFGDIDGDGDQDWFVTTIAMSHQGDQAEANSLYRNDGGRLFANIGRTAGVGHAGWGWGTNFFDYDNDGDLDIALVNNQDVSLLNGKAGPVFDAPMKLYRNDGSGSFTDVSAQEGVNVVGWGVGILNFDYDNDGDLDLFAVHQFSGPALLRNSASRANGFLRLSLEGTLSNRDGIGAFITLQTVPDGAIQTREFNPTNAYMAQLEPFVHFGLGGQDQPIHRVTIRWPSSIEQTLSDVLPNQTLHVVEDASLLAGAEIPAFAQQPAAATVAPRGSRLALSVAIEGGFQPTIAWYRNGVLLAGKSGPELVIDPLRSADAGYYHAVATNSVGSTQSASALVGIRTPFPNASIARQWNEAMLDAARINFPDPPIVARAFFHVSAAMWDAFWPYHPSGWTLARPVFHQEALSVPSNDPTRDQAEAISYAAYRVASERYRAAFNHDAIQLALRDLMLQLGYDPDNESVDGPGAAAVGNRIAAAILAAGLEDGSNEAGNYADLSGYAPVNEPLVYDESGITLVDPNRWQPLDLVRSVTKNGIDLGAQTQSFLAPGWNAVTPFALVKPTPITVLLDPGPPPLFGTETESEYIRQAIEVIQASALLDPNDGAMIDVSPSAARQNNPFLTQNGQGHPLNPVTGQPYPPNVVKRGDYFRITSEFWSDGPGIEGPPGVWNMLHNEVTDDPRFERRLGGVGPLLSPLEWDLHAYLAINGALHDAAIATWTIKAKYDYVRPISMIRYLASLGQSTDPDAARYHPSGLPLIPGSIELITAATAAPGGKHAHLAAHEGEIALRCWLGVPADPRTETAGVGWKRAADWTPYHLRTFPTPNFAGYVSGHSVFSRAGAEAMALLTGSPFFPGGLKEIHFAKGKALQVEYGPSEDLTVQVATYYDAADLTGKARIYCGVHIEADDFNGRKIGARVGTDAFLRMLALRGGRSDGLQDALVGFANGAGLPQAHLTEFVFVGNSGLPTQQLRRRSEIASDSPPGIYPIATDDVSQFAIMAKGQPVSFIDARGSVGADQRLHLDFRIETDEPVYLLARAFGDNGPLEASELIAFEITPDGVAEVARNADWIEDQRASTAVSFLNRRDLSNTELPSGQPALSLILSRGAYRVELAADDAAATPARLQLEVVNDTP